MSEQPYKTAIVCQTADIAADMRRRIAPGEGRPSVSAADAVAVGAENVELPAAGRLMAQHRPHLHIRGTLDCRIEVILQTETLFSASG